VSIDGGGGDAAVAGELAEFEGFNPVVGHAFKSGFTNSFDQMAVMVTLFFLSHFVHPVFLLGAMLQKL
jgi:hypothetical protein